MGVSTAIFSLSKATLLREIGLTLLAGWLFEADWNSSAGFLSLGGLTHLCFFFFF
jgi:hypothetical protein